MLQSCRLGSTDLEVSELGIGTARLVHAGARSTRAAMAALNHALDSGVTYVDTADSYGFGMSERIVGAALHSRRDRVVLATKLGYVKKITAKALGGRRTRTSRPPISNALSTPAFDGYGRTTSTSTNCIALQSTSSRMGSGKRYSRSSDRLGRSGTTVSRLRARRMSRPCWLTARPTSSNSHSACSR
jgi:hypothetical protein